MLISRPLGERLENLLMTSSGSHASPPAGKHTEQLAWTRPRRWAWLWLVPGWAQCGLGLGESVAKVRVTAKTLTFTTRPLLVPASMGTFVWTQLARNSSPAPSPRPSEARRGPQIDTGRQGVGSPILGISRQVLIICNTFPVTFTCSHNSLYVNVFHLF